MCMINNKCPATAAIDEIRTGGYYFDADNSPNSDKNNIVKLGGYNNNGNNNEVLRVCDETSHFQSAEKMKLARFKMSHPNDTMVSDFYEKNYARFAGADYNKLYIIIIDIITKNNYLYNQFVKVINSIGVLEEKIRDKIHKLKSTKSKINVSLPDAIFHPHVDHIIKYRADVLLSEANKIIDYFNKLNINVLLKVPQNTNIKKLTLPKFNPPVMTTIVSDKSMDSILRHLLTVCQYVAEIEKFHCNVINHFGELINLCDNLILNI